VGLAVPGPACTGERIILRATFLSPRGALPPWTGAMVKRGGRVELSSVGRRRRILQEIFLNPAGLQKPYRHPIAK
jgi:hypothetical protein